MKPKSLAQESILGTDLNQFHKFAHNIGFKFKRSKQYDKAYMIRVSSK